MITCTKQRASKHVTRIVMGCVRSLGSTTPVLQNYDIVSNMSGSNMITWYDQSAANTCWNTLTVECHFHGKLEQSPSIQTVGDCWIFKRDPVITQAPGELLVCTLTSAWCTHKANIYFKVLSEFVAKSLPPTSWQHLSDRRPLKHLKIRERSN